MSRLADYVVETASNPGTGTVFLAGAPTGRRSFMAALGAGGAYYYITDGVQAEWGSGTVVAGTPNTLSRDTVLGNTAGTTAKLNFTGTVTVYNALPAAVVTQYWPATNTEVLAGTDATKAVTPASLSARTATDTRTGLLELATNTEVLAGTDTSRAVTPAGLRAALTQLPGRNRAINGDMAVWQRGTTFACPADAATYTADRKMVYPAGSALTAFRSDLGNGEFRYLLAATGTAGNIGWNVSERVEAANIADLAGQACAISAWVYNGYSASIVPTLSLWTPDAEDNYAAKTVRLPTVALQSCPTGWSRVTWTGTLHATASRGLEYIIGLPAHTNPARAVAITGVQVEAGSSVTAFGHRSAGLELMLCQRYFQSFPFVLTTDGASGAYQSCSTLLAPMRVPPVITTSGGGGGTFIATGHAAFRQQTNQAAFGGCTIQADAEI